MAWIPYTKDLPGKPEVARIAKLSGRSIRETVAILLEFWAWADEQFAVDGLVDRDVDACVDAGEDIDMMQIVRGTDSKWWDAVASVGWIKYDSYGNMLIPHFGRWMGESAKLRLQKSLKQQRYRKRKQSVGVDVDGDVGAFGSTRSWQNGLPQNRTEQNIEKKKEEESFSVAPPPSAACAAPSPFTDSPISPDSSDANGHMGPTPADFQAAWNASSPGPRCTAITGKRRSLLKTRNRDQHFREHWKAALTKIADSPFLRGENDRGWLPTVEWFLRPDTVLKIMEGFYERHQAATSQMGIYERLFGKVEAPK